MVILKLFLLVTIISGLLTYCGMMLVEWIESR